jgi:hypothetical protein
LQTHPRDGDLLNKPISNYAQMPIENYVQMNMIYAGCVPQTPISPIAIHCALIHLMEHKTQATRYLAMSPECKISWFTAFLKKYYL